MKQVYVKPRIIVERLALTQSIASGCGVTPNNSLGEPTQWYKSTCGWSVDGLVFFLEGMNVCKDIKVKDEDNLVDFCYNNPDGAMIFSSL